MTPVEDPVIGFASAQLILLYLGTAAVAFPARPRHALLATDLVTWQAMVGRHILEDIVGRVAQVQTFFENGQNTFTSMLKRGCGGVLVPHKFLGFISLFFHSLALIGLKYYKDEEAKELLEVITAERLETEQRQKLEQQEQLSIEKLRLEMELSRIANQSANQNNGQTSRVKSLNEIVKMVRLLTVKVPNKSDGWEHFFSSLERLSLVKCELTFVLGWVGSEIILAKGKLEP
ncbi:hypothetical protein TNCV_1550381 [Trichonephila clavipes]|uniref:Uncharacterized protein n=1 Tax=Trichonephila clavipes TaxID=2585209 RepID=A0A8X6VAU7_TRICX|nr:hypothetical protein TNCV_1550381 [Trichonephila clavipes]